MPASAFYLSGDFNDWRPEAHRFEESSQPYGVDEWGHEHPARELRLGCYHLELDLPAGPARFKILEGPGWDRQWTSMRYMEREQDFAEHRFQAGLGLRPGVIVPRGGGRPPHMELTLPGGRVRFDFHPASRTLCVHGELERAPAPQLRPWQTFSCDDHHVYDTWLATPYGYAERPDLRYPLCLVFDGRSQLYGEDPEFARFNDPRRQLPRIVDRLVRHGLLPPPIVVGVEVPRAPAGRNAREQRGVHRRREALSEAGALNASYRDSILNTLLPALEDALPLADGPAARFACGHSWGADFLLNLLAEDAESERFGGALALSPSRPLPPVERLCARGSKTRLALVYGLADLGPFFLTDTAACRARLAAAGVPHLVQLCPEATHDPESFTEQLPAALSFVGSP